LFFWFNKNLNLYLVDSLIHEFITYKKKLPILKHVIKHVQFYAIKNNGYNEFPKSPNI